MVRTHALALLNLLDLVTVHVGNICKFQLLIAHLNQFPSVFNQNLQYASDVHQYSSRYEKKINFYTPYYTTNLREKNYVYHDSEH